MDSGTINIVAHCILLLPIWAFSHIKSTNKKVFGHWPDHCLSKSRVRKQERVSPTQSNPFTADIT